LLVVTVHTQCHLLKGIKELIVHSGIVKPINLRKIGEKQTKDNPKLNTSHEKLSWQHGITIILLKKEYNN